MLKKTIVGILRVKTLYITINIVLHIVSEKFQFQTVSFQFQIHLVHEHQLVFIFNTAIALFVS